VLALGSGVALSSIAGNGGFAVTATRIAASERWYRVALSCVVIVTLSSSLLAFALYVILNPVNGLLSQLGMIFSLADSFLGLIVRACSFVRLHLYLSSRDAGADLIPGEQLSNFVGTIAATTENIGGISFGIGSCLFFYLFFKSRFIPRMISLLGLPASVIWTVFYFAGLVFPQRHSLFQQICFPPMAIAEIVTGAYLLLFSVGKGRTTLAIPTAPALDV
jgi:hypothetical protein